MDKDQEYRLLHRYRFELCLPVLFKGCVYYYESIEYLLLDL